MYFPKKKDLMRLEEMSKLWSPETNGNFLIWLGPNVVKFLSAIKPFSIIKATEIDLALKSLSSFNTNIHV
jgi:hypothetical protein